MTSPDDEMSPPAADPMIGRTVGGRYRIEDVLGEGGIAVVYRAEHEGVGRKVALKMLHEMYGEHEELRARFQREGKALAALSHPNIVNMVDYGLDGNAPYLVMELLEGINLRELLDAEGPLEPKRAFAIMRQILRALDFAHGQGLVHRDLKPGNVFLQALPDTADHVKILDFGFAKFLAGDRQEQGPALTRAGKVFGTPAYMAPEQVTGGGLDARADIYACGVLVYEMLSMTKPFTGEVPDIIRAKVVGPVPTLAEARPDAQFHPDLEAFVGKALAHRDDRFASAAEMLRALDALPEQVIAPQGMRTTATSVPAPASNQKRNTILLAAALGVPVIAALLVCAGAVGIMAWSAADDEPPEAGQVVIAQPQPGGAEDESVPVTVEGLEVPDPWSVDEDELPALLWDVRSRIEAGEEVDQDTIQALRRHARIEDDGRVWLLVGHIYAQRGWKSDAVSQYLLAHRVDPALRGDPRMLANLVAMSAEGGVAEDAQQAVGRIYGSEALPTIDAALSNPNLRPVGARRLEDLRDRLGG